MGGDVARCCLFQQPFDLRDGQRATGGELSQGDGSGAPQPSLQAGP